MPTDSGLVIGVLARFIEPGADPMDWILAIAPGIAGACIGGMVAPGGGRQWWVASIVAAIVLLLV